MCGCSAAAAAAAAAALPEKANRSADRVDSPSSGCFQLTTFQSGWTSLFRFRRGSKREEKIEFNRSMSHEIKSFFKPVSAARKRLPLSALGNEMFSTRELTTRAEKRRSMPLTSQLNVFRISTKLHSLNPVPGTLWK